MRQQLTPPTDAALGLAGIALSLAIKNLKHNSDTSRVEQALASLASFPEPDARRTIQTVRSLLLPEEWQRLLSLESHLGDWAT